MHTLKYNVVALSAQRASLVALTVDYLNWLSTGTRAALGRPLESMAGMSIPEYAEKMADEIFCGTPQRSVFYLVETHGELAAMIGLGYVRPGVAEIRRLYVRPEFRGRHFGDACLRMVMSEARDFGYQTVLLDAGPFMYSALRLFRRCGFKSREPYQEVAVPAELHASWVFMECDLTGSAPPPSGAVAGI